MAVKIVTFFFLCTNLYNGINMQTFMKQKRTNKKCTNGQAKFSIYSNFKASGKRIFVRAAADFLSDWQILAIVSTCVIVAFSHPSFCSFSLKTFHFFTKTLKLLCDTFPVIILHCFASFLHRFYTTCIHLFKTIPFWIALAKSFNDRNLQITFSSPSSNYYLPVNTISSDIKWHYLRFFKIMYRYVMHNFVIKLITSRFWYIDWLSCDYLNKNDR